MFIRRLHFPVFVFRFSERVQIIDDRHWLKSVIRRWRIDSPLQCSAVPWIWSYFFIFPMCFHQIPEHEQYTNSHQKSTNRTNEICCCKTFSSVIRKCSTRHTV